MPAPSQRRPSIRRPGSSVRLPAAAPQPPQKAITDELEVQTPDGGQDSATAHPAISGRSSAVRSSRRLASTSSRTTGSGRKSARRPLTPEEQAAKRAATKSLLVILFAVAVVLCIAAVLVLVVFRKDPVREDAVAKLGQLQATMPAIDTRVEYEDAKRLLDGLPVIADLAPRRAEIAKALAEREAVVAAADRAARVAENRRSIIARLAKLTEPETDLKQLAADAQAFMRNPVELGAAPNSAYTTEFAPSVSDMQVRIAAIEAEAKRRQIAATTGAVQRVQLAVEDLVRGEKFGEAEALIADSAAKFPEADFKRVRTFLTESAASAWTTVTGFVDNRYTDANATGIAPSMRQKALEEAHARLDQVIAGWGLETYVNQAKELRAKN